MTISPSSVLEPSSSALDASPASNDERLRAFLGERDARRADALVCDLLCEVAPNVLAVWRKRLARFEADPDGEADFRADCEERLLRVLSRCKASHENGDGEVVIRHLPALAGQIADNVAHEALCARSPRRKQWQNRVLYVLSSAKGEWGAPLFARWQSGEARLCGFAAWEGRTLSPTSRHFELRDFPSRVAPLALPGEDAHQVPLPRALAALFSWLDLPGFLSDVVSATAQWNGIHDSAPIPLDGASSNDTDDAPQASEIAAPALSPEARLVVKAHCSLLWSELEALSLEQRRALLFHLSFDELAAFVQLGITSGRGLAAALGVETSELSSLCRQLPWSDRSIAERFGYPVGNVAIWRMRARDRLHARVGEAPER